MHINLLINVSLRSSLLITHYLCSWRKEHCGADQLTKVAAARSYNFLHAEVFLNSGFQLCAKTIEHRVKLLSEWLKVCLYKLSSQNPIWQGKE